MFLLRMGILQSGVREELDITVSDVWVETPAEVGQPVSGGFNYDSSAAMAGATCTYEFGQYDMMFEFQPVEGGSFSVNITAGFGSVDFSQHTLFFPAIPDEYVMRVKIEDSDWTYSAPFNVTEPGGGECPFCGGLGCPECEGGGGPGGPGL